MFEVFCQLASYPVVDLLRNRFKIKFVTDEMMSMRLTRQVMG